MSEARKMRRRLTNMSAGGYPMGPASPEAVNDMRRQSLAEELVKLGIEELSYESFSDTHKEVPVEGKDYTSTEPTLTLEEWFLAVTKAAKAAAEEMYPELPEEEV